MAKGILSSITNYFNKDNNINNDCDNGICKNQAMELIKNDFKFYKHVTKNLKNDKDFLFNVVLYFGYNVFEYVEDEYKDKYGYDVDTFINNLLKDMKK